MDSWTNWKDNFQQNFDLSRLIKNVKSVRWIRKNGKPTNHLPVPDQRYSNETWSWNLLGNYEQAQIAWSIKCVGMIFLLSLANSVKDSGNFCPEVADDSACWVKKFSKSQDKLESQNPSFLFLFQISNVAGKVSSNFDHLIP